MKVVSVVSAKGGVGKTTLAANLAAALAASGRRVVAVDFDPQNGLRLHFGVPVDSVEGLARSALAGAPWSSATVVGVDDMNVLAFGVLGVEEQHNFERHLDSNPQWFSQGIEALPLGADDIVVVDTPPGSTPYTRAALAAAHFALHVVFADAACYAAIPQMQRLIDTYAAPRPEFIGEGYVINQVDTSRQLNKDVVRVQRDMLGDRMFSGVIHVDEAVCESLACNTTVLRYDALCQAATDLRACAAWLLEALDASAVTRRSVA
jgi:cellulose synthase operon protein YhjQ